MVLVFLVLAAVAFGVETVLGFEWFGSTNPHPFGWIAAGLVLVVLALIWPHAEGYRHRPPA
jgi:hypothetical protein